MKTLKFLIFFVLALTMSVSSCKKDESNTSTPKDILTSKSWKLSSLKVNGVETIEDCNKDDIMTFAANGTYTTTVGAITCYSGETNTTGTWSLSTDGKTLTVDGDAYSVVITESKVVATIVIGTETTELTVIPT
jgi:triacylglycerol esterase/lipase EstA (alpha/beta hydrolase family)